MCTCVLPPLLNARPCLAQDADADADAESTQTYTTRDLANDNDTWDSLPPLTDRDAAAAVRENSHLAPAIVKTVVRASRDAGARTFLFASAADALVRVHVAGRRNAVADCREALEVYETMHREQIALVIKLARSRAPDWSRGEFGEPLDKADDEGVEFERFCSNVWQLAASPWSPCDRCMRCRCLCVHPVCTLCSHVHPPDHDCM